MVLIRVVVIAVFHPDVAWRGFAAHAAHQLPAQRQPESDFRDHVYPPGLQHRIRPSPSPNASNPASSPTGNVDTIEAATAIQPVAMPSPDRSAPAAFYPEDPAGRELLLRPPRALDLHGCPQHRGRTGRPASARSSTTRWPRSPARSASPLNARSSAAGQAVLARSTSKSSATTSTPSAARRKALYDVLAPKYGYAKVQPDPLNFNLAGPEIQFRPNPVRTGELGIDNQSLGLAVRSLVDGLVIGDYRLAGESIDLLLTQPSGLRPQHRPSDQHPVGGGRQRRPDPRVAHLRRSASSSETTAPQQINRIDTQRSITFSITPPPEMPLALAVQDIQDTVSAAREPPAKSIPPSSPAPRAAPTSFRKSVARCLAPGRVLTPTRCSAS